MHGAGRPRQAWYADAVRQMAGFGLVSGYADGTFQPGANITRGQMAKILYNLM